MIKYTCNPKEENTHKWGKPDYINPVKCVRCGRKITLVMSLAKLERPEITLEDFRYLAYDKNEVNAKLKEATYWELDRMVEEAEARKALMEVLKANNNLFL